MKSPRLVAALSLTLACAACSVAPSDSTSAGRDLKAAGAEMRSRAREAKTAGDCLSETQWLGVVDRARQIALSADLLLSPGHRQFVETTNPWMAFDCPESLTPHYTIWWELEQTKQVVIKGDGSILLMEHPMVSGGTVTTEQIAAAQRFLHELQARRQKQTEAQQGVPDNLVDAPRTREAAP